MSTTDTQSLRDALRAINQDHLLNFEHELTDDQRQHLLQQITELDTQRIPEWVEQLVLAKPGFDPGGELQPPDVFTPRDPSWDRTAAHAAGEQLIRAGKVAAFTVAGGQGSRLGYDGPKGEYPASAVRNLPLFACLAEWLLAARDRWGVEIPWYIMTSPLNDQRTREFFDAADHFGIDPSNIMFFPQGTLPSFDKDTARILLADKHAVATNPDGHGGSLRALHRSGALDDMAARGVEHLSYVQVDNPLARVVDPVFLGLHASNPASSAEMSSKSVEKTEPAEKVGVFARVGGRTRVIEYSDLPDELANQRDDKGRLRFNAGSIAIHAISVAFVQRLNEGGRFALPLHRAEKKVPCIDPQTAEPIDPETPNAVKLEAFVFDALPLAERSIVYETERRDEFAPIKNAEGKDSPESSRRIQTARAADWLEAAGVEIPRDPRGEPDCTLEISPRFAMTAEELQRKRDALPDRVERGQSLALTHETA